jgi:hypothetical protein
MKSPWYDGGISEKSNTLVKIEIKITPKAKVQKCFSHKQFLTGLTGLSCISCLLFLGPGHLSVSVSLVFTTTPYRLIFLLLRTIVEQNVPLISHEEPTALLYL